MDDINKYHQNQQQITLDDVIVMAAKNDMTLFAPLYDKYYVSLFRFVFQRTDTKEEAADITAQVFLNAMKNLKQYTPKGLPFSSWLFRIAYNEINQWFRKQKAVRNYYFNSQAQNDLFDESTAFNSEHSEQNKKILSSLLENLSTDELSIIEMKYVEKRSIAEIAEILDLTESNTKVRLHRVMNKIKSYAVSKKMTEVFAFVTFCSAILFCL